MPINRPLLYSGITAAVLTVSAGGLFCAKIESTKRKIDKIYDPLYAAEKIADANIAISSDQDSKNTEKAKCDSQKDGCEIKVDIELGATRLDIAKKIYKQCDNIPETTTQDACYSIASRGLVASAIPTVEDQIKCIEEATQCYSRIKKN